MLEAAEPGGRVHPASIDFLTAGGDCHPAHGRALAGARIAAGRAGTSEIAVDIADDADAGIRKGQRGAVQAPAERLAACRQGFAVHRDIGAGLLIGTRRCTGDGRRNGIESEYCRTRQRRNRQTHDEVLPIYRPQTQSVAVITIITI